MLRRSLQLVSWRALLASRGVLAVEGKDARKLLQGLVTSDVAKLDADCPPQHAAFLSAQGRVLFPDAYLVGGPDGSVLVDIDKTQLPALVKHLKKYKLRSKAKMRDASDDVAVFAVGGEHAASSVARAAAAACDGGAWTDPRLACLGARVLHRRDSSLPDWLDASAEASEELHALQLALLGVPNGSRELPSGDALPLEANLDLLNGVSFAKGCYLGQELTARTHFRGVVRKRLVPVVNAALVPPGGDGAGANDELPALANLPEAERRLAGQLLAACGQDDGVRTVQQPQQPQQQSADGAASEADEAAEGGLKLLNAKGKRAATLRTYDSSLGIGLALCRLEALASSESLSAADEGGPPPLRPLRPSWWPEHIGS